MISVIIPIYNVEDYLHRCVDSIIAQTYTDIEIILVNDGSIDKSPQICDLYASKYSHIKVCHRPNSGVANARKCGVENSNGDFIVFVDPDDWLPSNSIETLISHMTPDVDIVIGSFVYKSEKDDINRFYEPQIINKDEFITSLLTNKIEAFPWRNLYRRELFKADSFPSIKRRQDLLMNIKLSRQVNSVKLINEVVYCYFQRSSSTSYQYKYDFKYEKTYWLTLKEQLQSDGFLDSYYTKYIHRSYQAMINVLKSGETIDCKDPWVIEIINNIDRQRLSIQEFVFSKCLSNINLQRILISVLKLSLFIKGKIKQLFQLA